MATKTFTLHLAKPGPQTIDDLLSPSALARLTDESTKRFYLPGFADEAQLLTFVSPQREPQWFRDLRQVFGLSDIIRTNSSSGLLFFMAEARMFAASFSHGWMYLNEEHFEGDFGLRTALNALDDKKLKRPERANLGDALVGVALSPFQRDFKSFGLDDSLDLVRKISGETKEDSSANNLTGSRALKYSGECSIDDLPEIAAECLAYYNSDFYRQTSFGIIDVVRPVTDITLVAVLNNRIVECIQNSSDDFELGLPEAPEDEGVAYKFIGPRVRGRFPDLVMRNYVSALGEHLSALQFQTLQNHKVAAIYEDSARPDRSWSIRRALVGSVVHDGGVYAINDGDGIELTKHLRRR